MAARKTRWAERAIIIAALLAIAFFYVAGAAMFWTNSGHSTLAPGLGSTVSLIVAVVDFGWGLPSAARAF